MMTYSEAWNLADNFSLEQAAFLWCEKEPGRMPAITGIGVSIDPDVAAIFAVLHNEAFANSLPVQPVDGLHMIGNHSKSLVSRAALVDFARGKKQSPKFLFDTVLPGPAQQADGPEPTAVTPQKNKGGRPPSHDWNACMGEIVRLADFDGLPPKNELVEHLREWFGREYDREPATSEIYLRVKPICDYMDKARKK
jgi:hypothetical protein